MELPAKATLCDGVCLDLALRIAPPGLDRTIAEAVSSELNQPRLEFIPVRLPGGSTSQISTRRCDLIELDRRDVPEYPTPLAENVVTTRRVRVAIMLANWQLLIGAIEIPVDATDIRSAIACVYADGDRFIQVDGWSRVLFVQKAAVLWIEPFQLDPTSRRFTIDLFPHRPSDAALETVRGEIETLYT